LRIKFNLITITFSSSSIIAAGYIYLKEQIIIKYYNHDVQIITISNQLKSYGQQDAGMLDNGQQDAADEGTEEGP